MSMATPASSAFTAALRQLCPRCREGPIFSHWLRMHSHCPRCGLRFEREPGYFLGAMYFSYPLSVPILGLLLLVWYLLLPAWRIEFLIGLAGFSYLPFMPLVFRYSRVLWIYFERWASPNF